VLKRACNDVGYPIVIITSYYVYISLIFLTDHYNKIPETKQDNELKGKMSVFNQM